MRFCQSVNRFFFCFILLCLFCGMANSAETETDIKQVKSDEQKTEPKKNLLQLLIPEIKTVTGDNVPFFEPGELLSGEELRSKLAVSLAREELEGVVLGLHVKDAVSKKEYIDINSSKPLVPASNVKILTTAAALFYLGVDYRFKTGFYSEAEIDLNGSLKGDLIVYGSGDPMLTQAEMTRMVNGLYKLGLRKIEGDIIIDESYFEKAGPGPGWEEDDTDNSYQSPMGAFSFNYNKVAVYVVPGKINSTPMVSILPKSSYYRLSNTAVTTEYQNTNLVVHTPLDGDKNKITVEGNINTKASRRVFNLKIDNPAMFAGMSLKDTFQREDIVVTGKIKTGKKTENASLVYTHKSKRLSDIVNKINRDSNNHATEQVLLILGAELYGAPANWEKGLKAVKQFIKNELGFDESKYTINNGSGLASVNFVPAEIFTALLIMMMRNPYIGPEFVGSLAIAKHSGTLDESFTRLKKQDFIRAKTGSMEQVIALSGYLSTRSGHTLVISFIMNECRGHNRLKLLKIQEEIIYLLMSYAP